MQAAVYTPEMLRSHAIPPRHRDLAALFAAVREMHCVSVVGVSNLGKSALLRAMTEPAVQQQYLGPERSAYLFIYIDFNQMLEMSEQAFYELVLRCSIDALRQDQADAQVLRQVEAAYTGVVAPASNFEEPLRFKNVIISRSSRPTSSIGWCRCASRRPWRPSATSCRSASSSSWTRLTSPLRGLTAACSSTCGRSRTATAPA